MSSPNQHLARLLKAYPHTALWVDKFRQERAERGGWPDWCFLPRQAWSAIVRGHYENLTPEDLPPQAALEVIHIAAVATWRYSQGIYRFDPDMSAHLTASPLTGDLPSEFFYRLPEWAIYIETPGASFFTREILGFWCHLNYSASSEEEPHELRFVMNMGDRLTAFAIHIGPMTLAEALEAFIEQSLGTHSAIQIPHGPAGLEIMRKEFAPLVSMVLYLCAQEPEIRALGAPSAKPERPRPKKTHKGWRLFPPDKPKIWSVGAEIGAQLRAGAEGGQQQVSGGGEKKRHLRAAHWHHYRVGAGRRDLILRWIWPTVVGGKEGDDQ